MKTNFRFRCCLFFVLFCSVLLEPVFAQLVNPFPGTVVFESTINPIVEKVASPSIAILPNGDYLISNDFKRGTLIHVSKDKGKSWEQISSVSPLIWATIFVHKGDVYLIGTSGGWGNIVVYQSKDSGKSWSDPKDEKSGLIAKGYYATGPVPVVSHNGKLWRAFEEAKDLDNRRDFHALAFCIDENADLLNASNWKRTNSVRFEEKWINAKRPNWLEGNIVVTPEGNLINFIRLETRFDKDKPFDLVGAAEGKKRHEVAAVLNIDPKKMKISFENESKSFVDFPGAETKFTIRYDSISGEYWSIVNIISTFNQSSETYNGSWHQRNVLMLMSSKDLKTWTKRKILLKWNQGAELRTWDTFGFQYVDWVVDGDNIVFVTRTSWYGGRYHDANMITFDRIENFRNTDNSYEPEDLIKYTQHPNLITIQSKELVKTNFIADGFDIQTRLGKGLLQLSDGTIQTKGTKSDINTEDEAVSLGYYFDIHVSKFGQQFSLETLDYTVVANENTAKLKWYYSIDGTTFVPITKYLIPIENINEILRPEPRLYLSVYDRLRRINGNSGVTIRCALIGLNKKESFIKFEDTINLGGHKL